ncbi:MAG: heme biosynthesis protein HemY [Candidatus Binatia bacterium]|nr:MAG: heme biosynthesis protein HemY [Candidatus Binatia bacterium]
MERPNEGQQHDVGPLLQLTPLAVEQAKAVLTRKGMPEGVLRVSVTGGGCSGMQYSLSLALEAQPGDLVFEQDGLRIAVESAARPYLQGAVIDYVTALHGAGFKFLNPNASRTCGCGSSFSVDRHGPGD